MESKRKDINLIAGIAAGISIVTYIAYYISWYEYHYRLDEVYSLGTWIAIGLFSLGSFMLLRHRLVRFITLSAFIFHTVLALTYIVSWLIFGQAYGYIKLSLIIGLFIATINYIYDTVTRFGT